MFTELLGFTEFVKDRPRAAGCTCELATPHLTPTSAERFGHSGRASVELGQASVELGQASVELAQLVRCLVEI